jgi:hypothetical protein
VANILASETLADSVADALKDEGYNVSVEAATTVTVSPPTAAPVVDCSNFFSSKKTSQSAKWMALCAPTHSPTPAPEICVSQSFSGLTDKEAGSKAFGQAVQKSVSVGLGVNAEDVAVGEVSVDGAGAVLVSYCVNDVYHLSAKDVEKELEKKDTAQSIEAVMHEAGFHHAACEDVQTEKVVYDSPTHKPSPTPTEKPTKKPSKPTLTPTRKPSSAPSDKPIKPTRKPTHKPVKATHKPIEHHHSNDDMPAPLPIV